MQTTNDWLDAGHRVLPHTADIMLEAWAPTRAECLAEAVNALVSSFVDARDALASEDIAVRFTPDCDDDLLAAVLDEVIYQVEVHEQVPVDVEVAEEAEGEVLVHLATTPAHAVQLVGAAPKAVALHELQFARTGGSWHCHVTIDV